MAVQIKLVLSSELADPHLNYSARVRGRVTRTTCYASILSASRIKYRTGCTCHYLITVTIRGFIGSLMGSNTEIPIAIDRTVCAALYVCTLCVRVVDNLKVTSLTEEYWEDTL